MSVRHGSVVFKSQRAPNSYDREESYKGDIVKYLNNHRTYFAVQWGSSLLQPTHVCYHHPLKIVCNCPFFLKRVCPHHLAVLTLLPFLSPRHFYNSRPALSLIGEATLIFK